MMRLRTALLGAALMLAPVAAQAQSNYPSVGGATVPTSLDMCLNSSGQAVPWFNASGTWQCAGAAIPTTATLSGTGANNADAVASVATGLSSADTYNFVYNGATWDRARGDTTNGAWVNVKTSVLPTGAALDASITTTNTDLGPPGATACATDTGSCSLNALLQRLSQRLTTLITGPLPVTLPVTPLVASGNGVVLTPTTEAAVGIAPVVSTALESNHVICAAACNFYGGYITTGATAGWLLLANATSAPTAGGAAIAPIACVLAPANQTTSIGGAGAPIRGSTGIVMVFSTTGCLTNTASTTAFLSGQAK